eukprot:s6783_g1.t1
MPPLPQELEGHLDELMIARNGVADEGCRVLFEAFAACSSLAQITLRSNRVGDVSTLTLPSMFHSLLRASAWLLLAQAETCEDSQDVSFLQHALKIGDLGAEVTTSAATSPKIATHSLFVKFHKVAGRSEKDACSGNCGNTKWICDQQLSAQEPTLRQFCYNTRASQLNTCDRPMHTCTFHQSLEVIREAVSGKTLTPANSNLWPDKKRLNLLWRVEWARVWLPWNFQNKRI